MHGSLWNKYYRKKIWLMVKVRELGLKISGVQLSHSYTTWEKLLKPSQSPRISALQGWSCFFAAPPANTICQGFKFFRVCLYYKYMYRHLTAFSHGWKEDLTSCFGVSEWHTDTLKVDSLWTSSLSRSSMHSLCLLCPQAIQQRLRLLRI